MMPYEREYLKRRVVIYARVSTDHDAQLSALENQIDWYRQDFNIWPLHFWRTNDGENRRGITENLCVQGSLLFWDELLRRNPGLRIDSCAGGGRRSDMESMRRAVPLHYSDLAYGNIPVKMGFEQTMHEWLPYFKSKLFSWEQPDGSYGDTPSTDRAADAYVFYSALAPMVTLLTEATRDIHCRQQAQSQGEGL